MSRPIDEALEACLAEIEAGTPADQVLAAWPDPAEREALAPLVAGAAALGDLPPMDAARSAAIQAELNRVELSLYPAPAGGLLAQVPHAPLLLAALVGAAILAWLALTSGPPRPAPSPASLRSATPPPLRGRGDSSVGDGWGKRAGSEADQAATSSVAASAPGNPETTTTKSVWPTGSATPATAPTPLPSTAASSPTPPSTINTLTFPFPTPRSLSPQPSPTRESPLPLSGGGVGSPTRLPLARGGTGVAERSEAGEGVDITGKVTTPAGRPIAGAEVNAYRLGSPGFYVQRTDADGTYRLRLRPGAYVFQATAEGYTSRWFAAAALRGDATVVDVVPERPPTGVDFTLEPAHNTPDASSAAPAFAAGLLPDDATGKSSNATGRPGDAAGTPARAAGLTPQGGHP